MCLIARAVVFDTEAEQAEKDDYAMLTWDKSYWKEVHGAAYREAWHKFQDHMVVAYANDAQLRDWVFIPDGGDFANLTDLDDKQKEKRRSVWKLIQRVAKRNLKDVSVGTARTLR